MASSNTSTHISAIKYAHQLGKLSHLHHDEEGANGTAAVKAGWVMPQGPVILNTDGGRLPGAQLEEANKLNWFRDGVGGDSEDVVRENTNEKSKEKGKGVDVSPPPVENSNQKPEEESLRMSTAPSHTHPLFPPLPSYGPPSALQNIQCFFFRCTSAVLSLGFLSVVVLGSVFTTLPLMSKHMWPRLSFQNPNERRPFYEEEKRRAVIRRENEGKWAKKHARKRSQTIRDDEEDDAGENDGFVPTEGGPDPLICDVGYYARRVGLDVEKLKVETEDGFIIDLWHVYDPREFVPSSAKDRDARGSDISGGSGPSRHLPQNLKKKYPVLMIHGLLQSAGAYCTNDDDSLAFFLCKSGYDVWLGNNRCGFKPEHTRFNYSDPRMWAWNIRQMGVMDLPALISRVLSETDFEKLGLICHSQGTTETFVALAKEQRPDLGEKISVFCALAPAAYAGPLIGKMYFKFMRIISPVMFRLMFGIHSFIPIMMTMHSMLPGRLYGAMGYRVFNFLFNWSDDRWDRELRDRMFIFAPVYVSTESMKWWLGRDGFATQKCILQTRESWKKEDEEDRMEEYYAKVKEESRRERSVADVNEDVAAEVAKDKRILRGSTAWYDERVPPIALWIAGNDDLVDGRRLLRRFVNGREPHVRVVHSKIIEEYEHLDVIWAMDSIEKVGKEVRDVIWKTCDAKNECRVPKGCGDIRDCGPASRECTRETGQRRSSVEEKAARPRLKRSNFLRRLFNP